MINYYFITTPIHYLHAVEARKDTRFLAESHQLIILTDYHKSIVQIENIIDNNLWSSVEKPFIHFDRNKLSFYEKLKMIYFRKSYFKSFSRALHANDRLFWGNINSSWFAFISNLVNCQEIISLDDGLNTLGIIEAIDSKKIKFNYTGKLGIVERIILKNSNIDTRKLIFYTVYSNLKSNQTIFLHEFDHLVENLKKSKFEKSVYFIAQPLVFQNIISNEKYIELIEFLKKQYENQGFKFYYLPHRSTTLDYLSKNWNTMEFNYPVELLAVNEDVLPTKFVCFYSSAIVNLAVILRNRAHLFELWNISQFLDEKDSLRIENLMNQIRNLEIPNLSIYNFGKK